MKHKFRVAAINDGYCMRCGNSCHDSIHKIDLNPSDERLREMIAEKDNLIARYQEVIQQCKAQLEESSKTASEAMDVIKQLQRDAEHYRKLKPYIKETRGIHLVTSFAKEKLCVMRKWYLDLATETDDSRSLDEIIDALPEAK